MGAEAEKVLDALGNKVRREIVESLREEPRSVGELASLFPVSRPAISRHLKLLEQAGLVEFRSEGTRNIFHLRQEGFEEAGRWLSDFWDEALVRFAVVAENMEEKSSKVS